MAEQFFTNDLAVATLAGTERIPLDLAGGGSEYTTPNAIEAFVQPTIVAAAVAAAVPAAVTAVGVAYGDVLNLPNGQYSTDSNTADFTVAAAKVAGARLVVLDLTGALAAGHNIQIDTAAHLFSSTPDAVNGETYVLRIVNNSSGAFQWTLTTNTGITLTGTVTIGQGTWREWLVTLTSPTAATLQNIGSGTN